MSLRAVQTRAAENGPCATLYEKRGALSTEAFAPHGVHPDDLHTLSDLGRFPFLKKQDFRDNYPFGLFAVPSDRIARVQRVERHDR